MAAFDVERWRRIAPYLDQVLDITNEEDRASWLAREVDIATASVKAVLSAANAL